MSTPPVIKYPLDLTGAAPSNLISGEVHDLSALSQKAFVLNYGPFFTNSLVVTNAATGQPLTPKTQYVATQLLIDMTLRTGLDICAVIVITDKTLPANLVVNVTYQVLGGPYSASVDAIQQLITALNLGNQPVLWGDVLGKPVLFPPAPHLHDLGDIYGFEYMTAALERIVQAIYVGDSAQLQAIYQYIDHEVGSIQAGVAANSAAITAHLSDYTNPHRVTAAQVGLGSVANYPMATTAQAQAGVATNAYMNPALTAAAITQQVGNAFAAHVANMNNPHNTTAAQVGLGNVQNYGIASTAMAQAGTDNASYMTPALVAAAISQQALVPLNAHINNTSNPHQTTAAQVGLGNVANYAPAASGDAVAGTSSTLYMTPLTTAAAIAGQVGNAFQAHINNHSNPHVVTAAQVGLGNVLNVQQVQVGTGTSQLNNALKFGWDGSKILAQVDATPMGQLFTTSQPDPNLTSHLANHSNPHGVTAAQVGLGNCNNTSDLNKPISTATQNALNNKVDTNGNAVLASITLGGSQFIYLYESSTGAFSIRTGTSAAPKYATLDAAGNFAIAGTMTAAFFRPSDRRLKKNIAKIKARPLWRELDYVGWEWKDESYAGPKRGSLAQKVQSKFPEYVNPFERFDGKTTKTFLGVDQEGMCYEMCLAAGEMVDDNAKTVQRLEAMIVKQQQAIKQLEAQVKKLAKGG